MTTDMGAPLPPPGRGAPTGGSPHFSAAPTMVGERQQQKTRWTSVGAGIFCPVAVGRRPGLITLLVRSAAGELFSREWAGNGWSRFYSLGLPLAPAGYARGPVPADWPLAACSGEPDRIDVFARSPEGDLLHMVGNGGAWGTFACLGAPAIQGPGTAIPMGLAGPPAACSAGADRLDVFAVGLGGSLLHTSWTTRGWSEFESLGAPFIGDPKNPRPLPLSGAVAAAWCGTARMAVFVRGSLGDLLAKWWDGNRWGSYASVGSAGVEFDLYPAVNVAAPVTGPPAACSWGPERLDVFARGPWGDLLHKWWDGKAWSGFESLGTPISREGARRSVPLIGPLAACTWGAGRLDVFARAVDGHLYHAWWDGAWDHD